jgi:hypothetical protein
MTINKVAVHNNGYDAICLIRQSSHSLDVVPNPMTTVNKLTDSNKIRKQTKPK